MEGYQFRKERELTEVNQSLCLRQTD